MQREEMGRNQKKLDDTERNRKKQEKTGKKEETERMGDDETFYMHVLRFYLPKIARVTFDKHGLGLGIFTMQGFERRNKESKNTLKRFTNCKGNVLAANLRRLWDIYYYEKIAL